MISTYCKRKEERNLGLLMLLFYVDFLNIMYNLGKKWTKKKETKIKNNFFLLLLLHDFQFHHQ